MEKTESKTRSFCPEKEECEEIEIKHKAEDWTVRGAGIC